jgi:hypothetical protein
LPRSEGGGFFDRAWPCRPRFPGRSFARNRPNFEALGLDRIAPNWKSGT